MRHRVVVIPEREGAVRLAEGAWRAGEEAMWWSGRSILGSTAIFADAALRVVAWSGSYAEVEGGGMFEDDPRTWGDRGWSELRERVLSAPPGSVVVRPHARHVVSDVPGCLRLLDSAWASQRGVMLCYDPLSMLAESMLPNRDEHLRRMAEALLQMDPERVVVAQSPEK